MTPAELLADAFSRIPTVVGAAVDGLGVDQLAWRPSPRANSIAWLVWHLTRIQDAQVCELAGDHATQVWVERGWHAAFALPFPPSAHGYGQSSAEVGQVRVGADLLTGYLADTHAVTLRHLAGLGAADLDRVVDSRWTPPVTAGVRLVSILDDCAQHAGQAAYVRGLLAGLGPGADVSSTR